MEIKEIAKAVLKTGALVGGGAVVGCLLRNSDLSGLKGIGKLCAGIGIIGLSHAAGNAAADALEKDVDTVCEFIEDVQKESEQSSEEVVMEETVTA